jgi:hypothetical protein
MGDYLILVLGGQGGVSSIRVFSAEVAEAIVNRLNQLNGYSAVTYSDPELVEGREVPHAGVGRGGLGPKQRQVIVPDEEIPF